MLFDPQKYERCYGQNSDASFYGPLGKLVELIPNHRQPGSVIDLGAGDGRHALFLAKRGFDVTATDLSEAGLAKLRRFAARDQLAIRTIHADLSAWAIDQEYDVLVLVNVLQHLERDVALRLLADMQVKTRPGGLNAISLFTKTGDRPLMDRELDPGAFYAEDGWIVSYYADWEILDHARTEVPLKGDPRPDGTPKRSTVERLLIRKVS